MVFDFMFCYLLPLNIVLYKRYRKILNLIFINSQYTLHLILKKKNSKFLNIYTYNFKNFTKNLGWTMGPFCHF